jgi:hypothetical protein
MGAYGAMVTDSAAAAPSVECFIDADAPLDCTKHRDIEHGRHFQKFLKLTGLTVAPGDPSADKLFTYKSATCPIGCAY